MGVWEAQEQRRAWLDAQSENSSRPAVVSVTFDTVGTGEFSLGDSTRFGLAFTEEPGVGYSCIVLRVSPGYDLPPEGLEPDEDGALVDASFPRTSGGVFGWRRSKTGLYLGAWLYVTVDSATTRYDIRHSFVFTGVGVKRVPPHAVADLE